MIHLPYMHPLFVDYCTYFNGNHDYFECHEVLEEYWKDIAPGDKEHVLVGLVQLATGMYHWRRHNLNGATKILLKAQKNLITNKASAFLHPFHFLLLEQRISQSISQIKQGEPFQSFTLPLLDEAFERMIAEKIATLAKEDAHFLLHKHMLRDRSDILEARAQKIAKKRKEAEC
ncbi:DUF309 domain-containing protein [Lysinibacillus sp. LZ02]|uniref:DUF309 domain-containing protein n=1 Tax=Lysinibacillus sp. LZ02 TaxID=3420668 RepID=UPI003D36FD2A